MGWVDRIGEMQSVKGRGGGDCVEEVDKRWHERKEEVQK